MMSKQHFNKEQIEQLSKNEYVENVTEKSITYTSAFRRLFIAEDLDGKLPRNIFEDAGFDVELIGIRRINNAAYRWRSAYKEKGILGLDDKRKGNSGRPLERELTIEEKNKRLEARIKYLEAENELLKKLDARERRRKNNNLVLLAAEKFKLIKEVIDKYSLSKMVKYLCEIAGVSRSGYYNYFSEKSIKTREKRELKDLELKEIILKAYNFKNRKKGAKMIKMTLENEFEIIFNLKRIRRIMKKYDIICPIRRANPYKQMIKATKEHRTLENELNREFKQEISGKVFLTDITYLTYGDNKRAYLSAIKDGSTNEIPAYAVSENIKLDIVIKTIDELMKNVDYSIDENAFIHSDQGAHYTSPTFQNIVKSTGLGQSMSRRGNCWDNAPMESFFGHFKDEVNLENCKTFEELVEEIDDYMDYYNNYRYQWDLKKMTPAQYRSHLNNIAA
jgi:transposase InsO family protein